MSSKKPMVSVTVVTYNSSEFVIETLDSIAAQTYQNLELVISDDGSTDDTVAKCQDWARKNESRFQNIQILTVEKNTGLSANLNRAYKACHGDWIKEFDGDDIMCPDCVESCVKYVEEHPDTVWLFGKMEGFGRSKDEVEEYMNRCYTYEFFKLSPKQQLEYLLFQGNCIASPTGFINREKLFEIGVLNDERIPLLDDYPKWINLLRKGVRFKFIDKVLLMYRLSDNSISTTTTPSQRAKQSSALIYIYYKFKPRFHYYKSPIKKLGEVRKYIHAANTAWGGWFWKTMMVIDNGLAKILNAFGADFKM